ncbi:MAG: cytochrome ubiquinol oxidase subunit I [Acidobacteriota bacterium]
MNDILAARSQMAMSLAFHIVFAVLGIGMPVLMCIAEWRWLRSNDETYLILAKRWAKGTAILFAVGAVSGTVLSFELGLLFPKFMESAGAIIGMPFSLEGFAFFTEAIFLGIYLYGWKKVSPKIHLFSGAIVAVSGAASAVFVVIANSWMNVPRGFTLINGEFANISPIAAMMNPAAFPQVAHMVIAAYCATGFAVAGIHAFMLRRDKENRFHQHALKISLIVGGIGAILMPISGDFLAKTVAENQPVKLAAFEGQFETEKGAPLRIGGIPNEEKRETPYSIEIPHALSFLAYSDSNAVVKGLNDFPKDTHPPVAIIHFAFQIMVACGLAMITVAFWGARRWWRVRMNKNKRWFDSKWFLRALIITAPFGFIAIETGWTVTEVGRQPWIIYTIMRTSEAVTPMPNLIIPFVTFTILYIFLAFVTAWLLLKQVAASPKELNS